MIMKDFQWINLKSMDLKHHLGLIMAPMAPWNLLKKLLLKNVPDCIIMTR